MALKSKRIKFVLIIFSVLCFIMLANSFLVNALNIRIIPMIGAKLKSKYAYNLVPENYKYFLYIKDFRSVKTAFEKSDFMKKFKDNYIVEDMKSKYYQNIDLFFIKLDFNLIELARLIKDDFIVGGETKSQFIIASVDFNSKLLFSIINMIPSQINEYNYGKNKYYSIMKNDTKIFYSLIDDYIVLSNSEEMIKKSFDSMEKNVIRENLNSLCQSGELYFKNIVNPDYNRYGLLPDIKDLALKINTRTGRTDINCTPLSAEKMDINFKKEYFDVLKIFSNSMPLCYFNNNYDIQSVIGNIVDNSISAKDNDSYLKVKNDLDVLNRFSDSILFGYNDLTLNQKISDLSPQLCFVFTIKDNVTSNDADVISGKMKNIMNFIIGTKNWNTTNNSSKNYRLYREKQSQFNMIIYNRILVISYGNKFTDDIISQIGVSKPSFYDKFFKTTGAPNDNLAFYSFVNVRTLLDSIEPSFSYFLNQKLTIDTEEYNNSFGQLLSYMKNAKSLSVKLYYDKSKNIYYGNTDFVE